MDSGQNWHEGFFRGLVLEFWSAVTPPLLTRMEADFIAQQLKASAGARLLDIPCGNGRHALELARRGYRVTGVDTCNVYLEEAISNAAAGNLSAEFHRMDMRQPPRDDAPYDGAYCFGNSLGYLSHQGTLEFLDALGAVMKSGARFILDSGTVAESLLPDLLPRIEMEAGGVTMVAVNHYDARESRLHTDFEFTKGTVTQRRAMSQAVYTSAELQRMLAASGFETLDLYGSTSGKPFLLGAQHLLLVAAKR